MKKLIIPIICMSLFSCQNNKNDKPTSIDKTQTEKKSEVKNTDSTTQAGQVALEPFNIELNLTPVLLEQMKSAGEVVEISISVSHNYESDNNISQSIQKYLDEKGTAEFTNVTKQVGPDEKTVKIEGISIDKKVIDLIGLEHLQIEINTFSGRKAFENNIISADFKSVKYTDAIKSNIVIKCDVI